MPVASVINVKDYGAVGDGCADDTEAIQDALDALSRAGTTPDSCFGTSESASWSPWAVAVYFPAGIYRITAPLEIPFSQFFRLFGDGGRGGSLQGTVPVGTIIQQDTDDEPIFVFTRGDTHSWTIERLGFRWRNSQGPPPEPSPGDPLLPARQPGAVGVLFRPESGSGHCYHGRITECMFKWGWRGVAFDDRTGSQGGLGQAIAVWNTQIDHCSFVDMTGAGVRFNNVPGLFIGMPGNAFRSLLVQQVDIQNGEEQIKVTQQLEAVLDGLELEGSHHAPTLHVTGQATIRSVHFEHLELHEPNLRVVYLAGENAITFDGLNVDGVLDPQLTGPPAHPGSAASIIHCDAASLVLSGARGRRGLDQSTGGIALPDGDAFLVTGATEAQVQLVGKPQFPNPDPVKNPDYPHQVRLWSEYRFGSSPGGNVVAPPAKLMAELTVPGLAPGVSAVVEVEVPGAKPGDLVTLGPPPDLPAALVFSGVVAAVLIDDEEHAVVRIRLSNVGSSAAAAATGNWMIAAGGGPRAGEAQIVADVADALPPWPSA